MALHGSITEWNILYYTMYIKVSKYNNDSQALAGQSFRRQTTRVFIININIQYKLDCCFHDVTKP